MSMERTFIASMIFVIIIAAAFLKLDAELQNTVARNGTVSLELCAYPANCDEIMASWDERRQVIAAFLLGIDYLFLVSYSLAIFSALQMAARKMGERFGKLTVWISYMAVIAGIADAIENTFLISGMLSDDFSHAAWPASIAATIKFSAVAIAIAWFFIAVPAVRLITPKHSLQTPSA